MRESFKRTTSRLTAPPVTLPQVRDQLFLFTDTQYDTLLSRLLLVATERAEAFTGRYFSAVSVTAYFPGANRIFYLSDERVTRVSSLIYTDENGMTQTVANTNYTLDTTAERPVVRLNEGYAFPTVSQNVSNPVRIGYSIAEENADLIPDDIRHAILLYVAELFEQRSNLTNTQMKRIPLACERLLQPYRRWEL